MGVLGVGTRIIAAQKNKGHQTVAFVEDVEHHSLITSI